MMFPMYSRVFKHLHFYTYIVFSISVLSDLYNDHIVTAIWLFISIKKKKNIVEYFQQYNIMKKSCNVGTFSMNQE